MWLKLPARPPRIGRLAMQFGLAFALAMGVAGGIAFAVARQQLIDETDESLSHERDRLILPGQVNDTAAIAARIGARVDHRFISAKGYLLYRADGRLVWGGLEMPMPPEGFSAVRYHNGSSKWHEGRALNIRLPDGGRLIVIEHSEVGENTRQMLLTGLVVLVLVGALAGLGAARLLADQIARRLARTLGTAEAIARGDLSRRIPVDGLDGIFAEQAASLNHMLDRMEQMVRSQRQFASHLAHDLRTPLTRLGGLLRDNLPREDSDDRRLLEKAERECRSMIAIFDALLRLSEIEAGRRPAAMVPLPLAGMIEDVAETMEPVIADTGSHLSIDDLAPVTIMADAGLIQQLLVNLLENIVLHTPAGTHATIALARQGGEAVIAIADNGPGIAPDEHDRVIRSFERGADSGQAGGERMAAGSGLGLAIAQAVMRFHNGKLELADNRPGLIVRLRFPATG